MRLGPGKEKHIYIYLCLYTYEKNTSHKISLAPKRCKIQKKRPVFQPSAGFFLGSAWFVGRGKTVDGSKIRRENHLGCIKKPG